MNVEQDDARGDSGIEQYGPVLPFWRKLAYSTVTFGDSLPFCTSSFYLLFFLTSLPANARISPLNAGILEGLPAVLFFPLDPIGGFLSDRVRSRVGRPSHLPNHMWTFRVCVLLSEVLRTTRLECISSIHLLARRADCL